MTELEARLREVEDPLVGEDIVTMGLINDVTIDDGTASISLAFNTPFAPAELELGDAIRAAVKDVGLEPDLYAQAGEEHGFDEEVMPNVRNVVAVASGKGGVGKKTNNRAPPFQQQCLSVHFDILMVSFKVTSDLIRFRSTSPQIRAHGG